MQTTYSWRCFEEFILFASGLKNRREERRRRTLDIKEKENNKKN